MADPGGTSDPLLDAYEIGPADLDRIRAFGEPIRPRLSEYVAAFYTWLARRPEFQQHFTDKAKLARVQKLQEEYWHDFFEGRVDEQYLAGRRRVGEVHARIGLGLPVYFAAMSFSLTTFADRMSDGRAADAGHAAAVRSVTKLVHLDTAVVVETYARMTAEKLADQNRALMEMSTPVTAIWQGILLLPVVGLIDSRRAQDLMNAMLGKIAETRSRIFILDISGVAVVDTAVANHLIKITKATRLMGCDCTISGISPAIAQTVVELGVDVGEVRTTATLRDALEDAFRRTGVDLRLKPQRRGREGDAMADAAMSFDPAVPRVTLNLLRGCVVATLQADLTPAVLQRFREELLSRLAAARATRVVLDCSGVEVMDSEEFDGLRRVAAMARLLGATTVLVGLRAGVVSALVGMGVETAGVRSALSLDDAFDLLDKLAAEDTR